MRVPREAPAQSVEWKTGHRLSHFSVAVPPPARPRRPRSQRLLANRSSGVSNYESSIWQAGSTATRTMIAEPFATREQSTWCSASNASLHTRDRKQRISPDNSSNRMSRHLRRTTLELVSKPYVDPVEWGPWRGFETASSRNERSASQSPFPHRPLSDQQWPAGEHE